MLLLVLLGATAAAWRSDLQLTLDEADTLRFAIRLQVGGHDVAVELDTGSSRTWIRSSSSPPTTTTPFSIAYRDGSSATGVVTTDLVQFGAGAPPRLMTFGLVNETNIDGDGVVGLRPPQLAAIVAGADQPAATFMFAERQVRLGTTPDDLDWVGSSPDRWTIVAEAVRFGAVAASAARVRVDTGAAIVGVPDAFFAQLCGVLGADPNGFVCDCERRRRWWPPLQIVFGPGRRLTYRPAAWTRPVQDRPGMCQIVFRSAGDDWILGVPLLMQQTVSFRVQRPDHVQIGFPLTSLIG